MSYRVTLEVDILDEQAEEYAQHLNYIHYRDDLTPDYAAFMLVQKALDRSNLPDSTAISVEHLND